jgi:hypothetical protein
MQVEGDLGHSKDINAHDGDLCILIFRSLISPDKAVSNFFLFFFSFETFILTSYYFAF